MINSFVGFILAVIGCVIAFFGMYLPPEGVIDGSVLIFIGQCFIFSATLLGVKLPKLPGTKNDENKNEVKQ